MCWLKDCSAGPEVVTLLPDWVCYCVGAPGPQCCRLTVTDYLWLMLLCKGAWSNGGDGLLPASLVKSVWMRRHWCCPQTPVVLLITYVWLVRLLKASCLALEMVAWRWHLSGRGEESAAPCCYKYAAAVTAHTGSSWEEELCYAAYLLVTLSHPQRS